MIDLAGNLIDFEKYDYKETLKFQIKNERCRVEVYTKKDRNKGVKLELNYIKENGERIKTNYINDSEYEEFKTKLKLQENIKNFV